MCEGDAAHNMSQKNKIHFMNNPILKSAPPFCKLTRFTSGRYIHCGNYAIHTYAQVISDKIICQDKYETVREAVMTRLRMRCHLSVIDGNICQGLCLRVDDR